LVTTATALRSDVVRNALIGLGAVAGLVVCGFVAVPAAAAHRIGTARDRAVA
jgi:hypothetical protein